MSLKNLPYELLLETARTLPQPTLSALSRTSRKLHHCMNPLLWAHLQFGPAVPAFFVERVFPILPSPPYLHPFPPGENATGQGRSLDEKGVLAFYSAARRGWLRQSTLALVKSVELRDAVLGACFASGRWSPALAVSDAELHDWRALCNGDFHTVFRELMLSGGLCSLREVRVVYAQSLNLSHDLSGNELRAVQKAQDFCRTLGAYGTVHPTVHLEISTTQFALVQALFTAHPSPPTHVTSLETSIHRRPAMLETFTQNVLPNISRDIQHLTLIASGPRSGPPPNSIWDNYAGGYYGNNSCVFNDEAYFSKVTFESLKSIEYSAELFTFAWVPPGIQRLCVRHSRAPDPAWWKSLAKRTLRGLEELVVWFDCDNSPPTQPPATEEDEEIQFSFRDLRSLVIARNPPRTTVHFPYYQDGESFVSVDVCAAVVAPNIYIEEAFLEYVDVGTLSTLCLRGRLRSLTVQSMLHKPFADPGVVDSLANLDRLEWLHICIRDALGCAIPSMELVSVLGRRCKKLTRFVMEDRGIGKLVGLDDWVQDGVVRGLLDDEKKLLSAVSRHSTLSRFWVFDLERWRGLGW